MYDLMTRYVEQEGKTSVAVGCFQLELNDEKMLWRDGDVPISQCSMPCPLGYRKQLIKVVR